MKKIFLFVLILIITTLSVRAQQCQIGLVNESFNLYDTGYISSIYKRLSIKELNTNAILLITQTAQKNGRKIYFLQFDSTKIIKAVFVNNEKTIDLNNKSDCFLPIYNGFLKVKINGYYQGFCKGNESSHETSIFVIYNAYENRTFSLFSLDGEMENLIAENENNFQLANIYKAVMKFISL